MMTSLATTLGTVNRATLDAVTLVAARRLYNDGTTDFFSYPENPRSLRGICSRLERGEIAGAELRFASGQLVTVRRRTR